jgi:hypothetical protein
MPFPALVPFITELDETQESNPAGLPSDNYSFYVDLDSETLDGTTGAVIIGTSATTQIYSCRAQWLAISPWYGLFKGSQMMQSGTVGGSFTDPGWNLVQGNGWRTFWQNCVFQPAFKPMRDGPSILGFT